MLKKLNKSISIFVILFFASFLFQGIAVKAADYSSGISVSGATATIWFKSNVSTTWVNVHYKVNSGTQLNYSMQYNSSTGRYEKSIDASVGGKVDYSFTYNNGTPAYDTAWISYTIGSSSGLVSGSIYTIKSKVSGKALDVKDASTSDGAKIQQWTSTGATNQQFKVVDVGNGYYKLIAVNSGMALDDPNFSTSAGTQLQQAVDNGSDAQRWQIVDMGSGYYKVVCKASGLVMDVSNSSTADGAVVQQWTDNGTDAQRWSFTLSNNTNPTNGSIYSIAASSIPTPTVSGAVSVKVMNGTNGAYADANIYWGVLGINPSNGKWSYLDSNSNLVPISNSLNDASGHLTKNGANYANIYHKISETNWVTLPKITSGRMFLSVGSPCYIKTYDDGFAGPNVDNPTDPNRDVYFDFVEFTVNDTGYHGNTTRVDGFGFPIQHRLVNKAGNYDRTVGELETETRSGIFTKYQNEVPTEFKSLATLQAPYRIVAPIHGTFAAGGANANYFAGYSSYSTQDILLGTNGLQQNPQICAAINRHVYTDTANWNNPSAYYKAAPANYYAKFWHDHSIDNLAYGFCYDDVNQQAAYLEVGDPKGLIIRVGW
ncbi:beta-1,3-glucanase family protein [Clostridium sp. C8-1-8]|uniref:beta-1,3-glucanase family protein n=1 Tax=Clostridium sp. C8-1-8 TaxID=2698831 RepID=UPI0019238E4D|nr:beta-1,3-glucanase family protein [Clostridium sp. C8-1-8]